MTTRARILLIALLAASAACTGSLPPDLDGSYNQARHLFSGVAVGDDIDPRRGDREDWRKFHFARPTEARVLLVMAPLATNNVTGRVEIYDDTFAPVHGAPIQEGHGRYELKAEVEGGRDYYVVVRSMRGKAKYQIRLDGAPVNPCSKCTADQVCEGGRCLAKAAAPVDPCGGCPEHLACDAEGVRCVLPACVGVSCPSGRVCNESGACVRTKTRRSRRKKCGPGLVSRGGRCVPSTPSGQEPLPPEMSEVYARVVSVVDLGGGKTAVNLDKGSAQGLSKKLPPGRLEGTGATVRLKKIFAVRARAEISVPASKIKEGRVVVFRVLKKR